MVWETIAAKAVGDLAGGLGKGLGGAIGGAAGPFMGGAAESATYGTSLNSSGWVVNLGGTQVASASPTQRTDGAYPAAVAGSMSNASMLLPALAFGGAMLLLLRRKGRK